MASREPKPTNRNAILGGYHRAYQEDPTLTPTAYMMRIYPGEHEVTYRGKVYKTGYKTSDSAGSQWRKLNPPPGKRPTSGERIFYRSTQTYRQRVNVGTRRNPVYEYRNAPRPAGGMAGLWLVVVTMAVGPRPEHGEPDTRELRQASFPVRWSDLEGEMSTIDAVVAERSDVIQALIDEKVEQWSEGGSPLSNIAPGTEVEVVQTEIIPISKSTSRDIYDIGDEEDEGYFG